MATTVPNPFDTQAPATAITTPTADAPAPQISSTPQVTATQQGTAVQQGPASQTTVTPDQTVESRTAGIIANDSPLMQLAKTRSDQSANSRGLINSSMAVGAGQAAVMDAATKIAGQDASTYANSALSNTSARNVAAASDVKAQNDVNYNNTKAQNDISLANQDATVKTNAANLTSASNSNLASIEAQYKNLTTASSSAASIMNKGMDVINSIMANATLDAPAKQKAIDSYNTSVARSLQIIGAMAGDVDLSTYLDEVLSAP